MNLRIFSILEVNKGVKSNPNLQPVDIYMESEEIICIESDDTKIQLHFTREDLRSIMRLFDSAQES